MKLLIVDDSELIRDRLVNFFQGLADIDTADTLERTLKAAARSAHELAIVDLHLPDGNATRLIPELKRIAPGMRVAVLTNDASTFNAERCRRAGADWFFDKSIEFEALLALVRQQAALH